MHVCVCADTDRDLIALVVMTAEMQHLAQRFGDVLVIDVTYKTNVHHSDMIIMLRDLVRSYVMLW